MSFFTKALSKIGIGAAKIDAVLNNNTVAPGQDISGTINIEGGKVEQQINKIDLDVYCNYFVETVDNEGESQTHEKTCKINNWDIEQSFTISPGEHKQIPFTLQISENAPITIGKSTTWLSTNLDIDYALDKTDRDFLHIVPTPLQQALLSAVEALGFVLVEAECEGSSERLGPLPFVQELEFKTRHGEFAGKISELEVIMINRDGQLTVHLEIDRKVRGLGGLLSKVFGQDETNTYFELNQHNVDQVSQIIYDIIDDAC